MASREAYSHVIYSGRGLWLLKGCCKQWIWGFSEMRERIKLQPTRNAQINMLSSKKEIGLLTYNHENILLYLWATMCDCMCVLSKNEHNKMWKKAQVNVNCYSLTTLWKYSMYFQLKKKNQWEKGTWLNSGCYIPNAFVSVLVKK